MRGRTLEPGDIVINPIPDKHGLIISGKLPRWLFATLVHKLAENHDWIAIDDPRLAQAIVVYSKVPSIRTGDILPRLEKHKSKLEILFCRNSVQIIEMPSAQVAQISMGILWLGVVVYPTHRRVKSRNVVKFSRRLRGRRKEYTHGQINFAELDASVQDWSNHVLSQPLGSFSHRVTIERPEDSSCSIP